jgi:hypothetical protein
MCKKVVFEGKEIEALKCRSNSRVRLDALNESRRPKNRTVWGISSGGAPILAARGSRYSLTPSNSN